MTYERYIEIHGQYDAELNKWSDVLNSFPKLPNGLTPDAVRETEGYQQAKKMFNTYFQAFRKLNGDNKNHVKRKAKERMAARIAMLSIK